MSAGSSDRDRVKSCRRKSFPQVHATRFIGIIRMDDQTPTSADAGELQFDEAEFSAPTTGAVNCNVCHVAVTDQYFQINGAVLCENCSTAVKTHLTGGAAFPRFLKACVYGLAASFAGFLIYFGILKLTGIEIGLISILVGYMVGSAVRSGSGGRGGALYQAIAVGCTYLAIAASYSALLIPQFIADIKNERAVAAQPQNAEKAIGGQAENAGGGEIKNVNPVEPVNRKEITPFDFVFAIAFILAFMLALPILAGFSQPIGLLIVGFALWEAFKLNRKVNLVITGPHHIGRNPDPVPVHA